MKGFIFCVFAIMMLTPAQGEEEEQSKQLLEHLGLKGEEQSEQLLEHLDSEEEEQLECFRCDLGFWDTCFTTTTNCSSGERCYTGRGKAADVLDVKTLGCVKTEECDTVITVELFSNATVYVMTKYCCNTRFCNTAHKLPVNTLLRLTGAVLTVWHLTGASIAPQ